MIKLYARQTARGSGTTQYAHLGGEGIWESFIANWEVGTMSRTNTLASSLCLILVGVGPVAADEATAPKSLHMRSRPSAVPKRSAKNVAQAPAPDPAPPEGEPAGGDKSGNPAGATPASDPAAATVESTATPVVPVGEQASQMSEADFEKLAEQTSKEEVIVVTGSTIGRKTLTTPAPLSILNRETLAAAGRGTVGDIIQT